MNPHRPSMDRIYLDHAATTPLDRSVGERMAEIQREGPLNPSSPHHEGRRARKLLNSAREEIAQALALRDPRQVIFTRGGTEANNLVIWGRAQEHPEAGLAFSSLEHSSVRGPMEALAAQGRAVCEIPVAQDGTLDRAVWRSLLDSAPAPAMISVQAVNSETGLGLVLLPLLEAAATAGVPVHVDGVQGMGRIPLLPPETSPLAPAFLTLSAHKLGGPPGVGILIRDRTVPLVPTLFGGGQEFGFRPGTEDVAGAAGAARAISLAQERAVVEAPRLAALSHHLESALLAGCPALRSVAPPPKSGGIRAPHIVMLAAPGLPRDLLPGALDIEGIAVSAGSACRSGAAAPSPALAALLGAEARTLAPLRFSLGTETTEAHIEEATGRTLRVLSRIPALQKVLA